MRLLNYDPELDALPRSGIVHRLDKDTSGVMVVARSFKAHASLVDQLQTRSMSRVYEAVVKGETPPAGTIDAAIERNPRDRKKMAVMDKWQTGDQPLQVDSTSARNQPYRGFAGVGQNSPDTRAHDAYRIPDRW